MQLKQTRNQNFIHCKSRNTLHIAPVQGIPMDTKDSKQNAILLFESLGFSL